MTGDLRPGGNAAVRPVRRRRGGGNLLRGGYTEDWQTNADERRRTRSPGAGSKDPDPPGLRVLENRGHGDLTGAAVRHESGRVIPSRAYPTEPVVTDQPSCCCSGTPVVTVLLFSHTAPEREAVDLLLCGEHYRASVDSLHASGAVVIDADGVILLPDHLRESRLIPMGW